MTMPTEYKGVKEFDFFYVWHDYVWLDLTEYLETEQFIEPKQCNSFILDI